MKELTSTQQKAFDFIWQHIDREGNAPTLRELCAYMDYKAVGSAQDIVAALRRKGYLQMPSKQLARSFRLSQKGLRSINKKENTQRDRSQNHISIPCLGSVPAGNLNEAIEYSVGNLSLSHSLLPKPIPPVDELFALKAAGPSMIEAGIFDGDWLIIRSKSAASSGHIVVARSGSDVTVKRLMKDEKRGWYLKPENKDYSPIYADENPFEIVGQVIGLQRSFSN